MQKILRQTNTEISCLKKVDSATNTEPLIVISPDEIIELVERLLLVTFDKYFKNFVDTLSGDMVFRKPRLSHGHIDWIINGLTSY